MKQRPGCARNVWLALLLVLALSPLALAADPVRTPPPAIEYAFPDQSVWTVRQGALGEPDNPLLKLAEVLFARAGLPWHGKSYPASRLFRNLQEGTSPFSMLVRAPSLETCCLFSRKPVAAAEIRVYRRSGSAPIRSHTDLAGKRVISIRGYSYGGLAAFLGDPANRVMHEPTQGHVSAFRMLASGRADYLIDYAGPAQEILALEPIEDVAYEVLNRQDVHLVLSKRYPDAQELMAKLEEILDTLDLEALIGAERSPRSTMPLAKPRPSR